MSKRLLLCAAGLMWSCLGEVPHENPLDPESDLFVNTGVIRGEARTFYQPARPIGGVTVELWPGNQNALSDTSGVFTMRNVPVGEYWITARHKDYAPDSARILVEQGTPARASFQLDALPRIQSVTGRTFHVSSVPPEENVEFALLEAHVEDPDGPADIAAVLVEIPFLGLLDTLAATSVAGRYELKLFGSDLPEGRLHSILARSLLFSARDRLGNQPQPKELVVFRIIDQSPQIVSPQNRAAADSSRPNLTWNPFGTTFPFTFSVRVEKIVGGIPALAWERMGISSQTTAIRVMKTLTRGEYRWTLSVVDEFGNTSTSQPAAFLVN